MKKSRNQKTNQRTYRYIGIGILIASLLLLMDGIVKFLFALLLLPAFYENLLKVITANGIYGETLFYSSMILDTLIDAYAIVVSIILIKNNAYSKQLLYLVYAFVIVNILSFVLYLSLQNYMFGNLIIAFFAYLLLIRHNNKLSRIVKNKQ